MDVDGNEQPPLAGHINDHVDRLTLGLTQIRAPFA